MEVVNSCVDSNGGCDQICKHSPKGPVCSCQHGYRLQSDGKTCEGVI